MAVGLEHFGSSSRIIFMLSLLHYKLLGVISILLLASSRAERMMTVLVGISNIELHCDGCTFVCLAVMMCFFWHASAVCDFNCSAVYRLWWTLLMFSFLVRIKMWCAVLRLYIRPSIVYAFLGKNPPSNELYYT
jgi:hypothetical protein